MALESDSDSDDVTSEDVSDPRSEDDYDNEGVSVENLPTMATVEVVKMSAKRKTMAAILKEAAAAAELEGPKLGLFDLICIGIGTCVGTGVFVLSGEVLPVAGPAAVLSWMVAGAACLLSALSFMELSARLPTRGSTYVFAFHCLGELAAVISSVCLTLEYGISGAGVARSWSGNVASMVNSVAFTRMCFTPWSSLEGRYASSFNSVTSGNHSVEATTVHEILDQPHLDWLAGLLMLLCVILVTAGGDCGKMITNAFTCMKVLLILFMSVGCLAHWNQDIFESFGAFAPRGTTGIVDGATLLFFGFVGFDEVCCLASRSKDPARTMPRAIAGTLLGATVISGGAQLALSCVTPPGTAANFASAFRSLGLPWAASVVTIGEAALLPLVVFVSFLPQPELTAAMAEDGVLPSMFCKRDRQGRYVVGSVASGAVMVVIAVGVPFGVLWEVISLGVLVGFNFANASLIQLRYQNGGRLLNKRASMLTWGAMALSTIGSYVLWKGYLSKEMSSSQEERGNEVNLFLGLGFIVASMCVVATLAFTAEQIAEHQDAADVFRVPFVPWLPAFGFIVNGLMMATVGWSTHLVFCGMVAFILALHVLHKVHLRVRHRKAAGHSLQDLEAVVEQQRQRIAELEQEADVVGQQRRSIAELQQEIARLTSEAASAAQPAARSG